MATQSVPLLTAVLLSVAGSALVVAAETPATTCSASGTDSAKRPFFGDLHVHTAYSIDAYAVGTRVDPADAYAFAKGQELTLGDGRTRARLERPLDFIAVTDHAEYFDVTWTCTDPGYARTPYCENFRKASRADNNIGGFRQFVAPLFAGPRSALAPPCDVAAGECRTARRSQWARVQAQANEANEPCRFTAFVANEWSATPNSRHWHRNLIFASDSVPQFPINSIDEPDLESMWTALEQQCKPEQGCDVVAIPHNMNLAEGGGFDVESASTLSLGQRARFERIAEIYQHKGASECLPAWGADDTDDCGFELMLPSRFGTRWNRRIDQTTWESLRPAFYRNLLARGLQMQKRTGVNPLQLGVIASTDTHQGTGGATEEDRWRGHFGGDIASPAARFSLFPDASPGGLVGVWAEENTRASLFAALQRREVFGTSGPRIVLRFDAVMAAKGDPCTSGDVPSNAVHMGGTLPGTPRSKPVFVVQALADREPIEIVEIVRGVLGASGVEERVIPLKPAPAGDGRSVCAWYRDAEYDPKRPAFWYARVQQRPTKRWSKFDCEAAGDCTPAKDRMIRERAWASPIWRLP